MKRFVYVFDSATAIETAFGFATATASLSVRRFATPTVLHSLTSFDWQSATLIERVSSTDWECLYRKIQEIAIGSLLWKNWGVVIAFATGSLSATKTETVFGTAMAIERLSMNTFEIGKGTWTTYV